MTDTDSLGDRMKGYEAASTGRRAFRGQPIIARLDGKSFHTFTRGLKRPYDERLTKLMVSTTRYLVDVHNASVGYTQSDEITLAWYLPSDSASEYPYAGRFQKMESLMAAQASAFFNQNMVDFLPEKVGLMPVFDARVFVVPNLVEAYNCILWRQRDAFKNAISMAAQSMFSHKSLQGLNGDQMQERMFTEKGVNFNDFPSFFKRGTFVQRTKVTRLLTDEELNRIPPEYRPDGSVPVVRTEIQEHDWWLGADAGSSTLFPEVFES